MRRFIATFALLSALTGTLTLGVTAPAEACINGVRMKTKQDTQLLVAAEKELNAGNALAAWEKASQVLDHALDNNLQQRATRLRALAVVRSAHAPKAQRVAKTRMEYRAALSHLRSALAEAPTNNQLKAEHAEALGGNPDATAEDRAAALKTLEELAAADLMPSSWSWRALASLRADAGLNDEALQAVAQCKATSPKANLCTIPGLAATKAPNAAPRL